MTVNGNATNIISKELKIIHVNVNSLIKISRRYELNNFIKNNNPDIVLLNETKLNNKHKLFFENFKLVRSDRKGNNRGGGTAILVRKEIKFNTISNSTIDAFKYLETCIIKIHTESNNVIYIISAYYPPGNNDESLKRELQKLFESLNLESHNNFYILAGDLNCKHTDWGNSVNNHKGTIMKDWLMNNDIRFRINLFASVSPSYPRTNSYLDICIADQRIYIQRENHTTNCLKVLPYDSDHEALQIVASKNTHENFKIIQQEEAFNFNYKRTNWKKFQNTILDSLKTYNIPNNRNLANTEIEYYLNTLNDTIIYAIEKSVPKFQDRDQLKMFITPIIKKLHAEKSRTLTLIKRHNRLQHVLAFRDLTILKSKLKLIRKLLEDNLRISINKHHKTKLSYLNSRNPTNIFSESKREYRKYNSTMLETIKIANTDSHLLNRANINPQTIRIEPNSNKFIIKEKSQILNVIGAYMETIYASKAIDSENKIHRDVSKGFNRFLEEKSRFDSNPTQIINFSDRFVANEINESTENEYFITRDEITYIFRNLKGKLSSGIDNIPNIVLKNVPNIIIFEYCTLFNNMVNNSYFPKVWKLGKVVTIPKKDKDSSDPKNHRAITLLPNISKIFEVCINTRIIKVLDSQKIINENQFGFKYNHSTIHAINLLVSNVNWNFNKNLYTGACLIDFQKAFDNIWVPGLIYKIIKYNFPFHMTVLLYNMINERQFVVNHRGVESTKHFSVVNGLQQGTVNAPILFNIYIHELLNTVPESIGFADDIIVYHADNSVQKISEKLQSKFNIVVKYSTDWNMQINFDKCETILLRPPVGKCNYNIKKNWKSFGIKSPLNNESIPNKECVKYLGVYIDKFLYFNTHIKTQIEKARKAFFVYKSLFFSKYITAEVKILLYQALIRPILTYGCPIWFNVSPSYMERFRKFERKCIRSCTSQYRSANSNYIKYISNTKLYNSSNIIRIDNFIIKIIRNHILKSTQCYENNLIMAPYYTNDGYIENSLKTGFVPPEAFLFLDKKGIIQNSIGIPIFYHLNRRANIKAVDIDLVVNNDIRFDTSVSKRDLKERLKIDRTKYWWITN